MFLVTIDYNNGAGRIVKTVSTFSQLSLYLEWVQSTLEADANNHITIDIQNVPHQQPSLFRLMAHPERKVNA